MMDGYAVRSEDVANPGAELRCRGEIPAGVMPTMTVEPGCAIRINTGAPVPDGADCVVPIEQTEQEGDTVRIVTPPRAGQHITRCASYVAAGDVVLKRGVAMGASQIAVAATAGAAEVSVYEKPKVSILVTGDELVDASETPTPGQIRNSNGPSAGSLVARGRNRSGAICCSIGRS